MKWHNNFIRTRPIAGVSWSEYASTITDRFSTTLFQDGMGILTSTVQTGSLEEYCDRFDENLLRVTIAEEYAISIFLKGLKPEISAIVRVLDPKTMKNAYMLAKKQNVALSIMPKPHYNRSYSSNSSILNPIPVTSVKPLVNTSHLP